MLRLGNDRTQAYCPPPNLYAGRITKEYLPDMQGNVSSAITLVKNSTTAGEINNRSNGTLCDDGRSSRHKAPVCDPAKTLSIF